MRKFLVYVMENLLLINNWIYKKISKLNIKNYDFNNYAELTPIDTLDKEGTYIKSLKWAFDNEKISNIAISGKYGSGKSSVIESFKRHYPEYKYINISLAQFIDNCDENIEEKLEKRILEQLFYKVKYKDIPFSRYRKIRNVGKIEAIKLGVCILVAYLTSTILINPDIIKSSNDKFNKVSENLNSVLPDFLKISWINYIILIFAILSIGYLAIELIKIIKSKLVINKIADKNHGIEAELASNETIFNKYMDEIIYFFEVNNYEVIFFEDIDRFNNINIFTKLRELNILINNSEDIKQKVKFVYAIKDDIFGEIIKNDTKKLEFKGEDKQIDNSLINKIKYYDDVRKNRTKFFDYILPVIPIINNENSYDKLLEINNKLDCELKIDEKLLSDVSIYCDDMRLLRNIVNEYITVYYTIKENYLNEKENNHVISNSDNELISRDIKNDINFKFDITQLFAMIVYKNLYPIDFSNLLNNSGVLYDVFNNKEKYITSNKEYLNKEIDEKQESINKLEKEIFDNVDELYLCYKCKWINKYGTHVYFDNVQIYIDDRFKNKEYLKSIYYSSKFSGDRNWGDIDKSDFWSIDGSRDYYERFLEIEDINISKENRIKTLSEEIDCLSKQINSIENKKVCNLLNETIKEDIFLKLNKEVINMPYLIRMIKKGIINESYKNAISYFYQGKLSISDYSFLQDVFNRKTNKFDYKLRNAMEIVKKLYIEDFKEEYILNYDLIKFILTESKYKLLKEAFINKCIKLDKNYIEFIEGFSTVQDREISSEFIYQCSLVDNDFINKYYELKINSYIKYEIIINYINKASIEAIKNNINFDKILKNIIFETGIFTDSDRKIEYEKFEELVNNLEIKIDSVKRINHNKVVESKKEEYKKYIDIIFRNSRYEFNESVLDEIIYWKLNNQYIDGEGYYTLARKYNLSEMIKYIDNCADEYAEKILLKEIKKEKDENLIKIINSMDLEKDIVNKVIEKLNFRVDNLDELDKRIWGLLIVNKRIRNRWSEILKYYFYIDEIDDTIINYINDLSAWNKEQYTIFEDKIVCEEEDKEKTYDFEWELLINNKITNDSLDVIINSSNGAFINPDITEVDLGRLEYLIDNNTILMDKNSFESINSKDENLAINFIKKNLKEYIENNSDYNITLNQFINIINDNKIEYYHLKEVTKIAIRKIGDDNELTQNILKNKLCYSNLNEEDINILKYIISSKIDIESKVNVIIKNIDLYLQYEDEFEKDYEILKELLNSYYIDKVYKDKITKIIIENDMYEDDIANSLYKFKFSKEEIDDCIIDYLMNSQISEKKKVNLLEYQIYFKDIKKVRKWIGLVSEELVKIFSNEEATITIKSIDYSIRGLLNALKEKGIITDYKKEFSKYTVWVKINCNEESYINQ
ncbi:hypothetical protein KCL52_001035 [Clostridium perfringens]|nr:hypothetical protein [Clostridium perfringens]ELC8436103.1 hypothetical protein [Clostridium perfringens]